MNQVGSLNGFFVWMGMSILYRERAGESRLVFGSRENFEQGQKGLNPRIPPKVVHLTWFGQMKEISPL